MLPDQVSNPGPLTYDSGALPIALRGPAKWMDGFHPHVHKYMVGLGETNRLYFSDRDPILFSRSQEIKEC